MKNVEINNYGLLKIALKAKTSLTLSDWIRMQYLLANRLYIRICIKMFEPAAPYREVNLTPLTTIQLETRRYR